MLWLSLFLTMAAGNLPVSSRPVTGSVSQRIVLTPEKMRLLMNADVCYTMRSYVFEAENGNAPKLVSQSTCTPAKQGTLRVSKPGKARLMPL
jgi:hypothetical protein